MLRNECCAEKLLAGIVFSLSKWVRLLTLGIVCGSVALVFAKIVGMPTPFQMVVNVLVRFWFLDAYLMLMLLAPYLNAAFDSSREKLPAVLCCTVLLLSWNWLTDLNLIRNVVPRTPGMGSYTFVMMVCVYGVARILRHWHEVKGCPLFLLSPCKALFLLGTVLSVFVLSDPVALGVYSSPFSLLAAALLFSVFRRISLPRWLRTVVLFVSPATFAIILLHSNPIGAHFVKSLEGWLALNGVGRWCAYVMTGAALFASCLGIELIRRQLVIICRIFPLYRKVDSFIERNLSRCAEEVS